jgi:DNA-directed RNA polymerase specialized sigma24 family protein
MTDGGSVTLLLGGVKAGDQQAIGDLWDRYFRRLVGLAAKRLPARARRDVDEEDVALSAFHSFCNRAVRDQFPQLTDRDDLWRLLAVITMRKVVFLARRRSSQKRGGGLVRGESALLDGHGGDGPAEFLGDSPSPEIVAQVAESCDRLMEALGDETLRVVAWMKMEGHNASDIARLLEVCPRTIDRKLRLIRAIWEQQVTDES